MKNPENAFFNEPLNVWVRENVSKPDKSATGLAETIGVSKMAVSNWAKGKHPVKQRHVAGIEKYFGVESPVPAGQISIPVKGKVGFEQWTTLELPVVGKFDLVPSRNFPKVEYLVFLLECDAMWPFFVRNDKIVFYKFNEKIFDLKEGNIVAIERSTNINGLKETSVRVVSIFEDRLEFRLLDESKPVVVHYKKKKPNSETVKILGIFCGEMVRETNVKNFRL